MSYAFKHDGAVNQSDIVLTYLRQPEGQFFTAAKLSRATGVPVSVVYSALHNWKCKGVVQTEREGNKGSTPQRYCYQTRAGRAA